MRINSDCSFVLKHPEDDAILVRCKNGKFSFSERGKSIKDSLESGINVPANLKGFFQNKSVINLSDPQITDAFRNIYFPNSLQKSGFVLEEITKQSQNLSCH